jgi:hypothetical protein
MERDWMGLNPIQVKIFLNPLQSCSIQAIEGLTEQALKRNLLLEIRTDQKRNWETLPSTLLFFPK